MKITEIGWTPKDWEVKKLSDVATNSTGLTYSPDDVSSYGTLVLRSSNIQNDVLAFEDNVFVLMDIPERAIAHTGDILVCVRNGSRALIGKSAPITEKADGMAFGAFMTVLRATDINPQYLLYAWRSNIIQEQINATLGATINQITNADLKTFDVPFPTSPSEQRRIASVLSDTDSLIASLSRNIEKKRLMKQGVMQQLLTGKTRLKGFYGNWVEKTIGGIGDTYNGITGKTKADFGIGNSRYITFLNVLNNPIIDTSILERVNIEWGEGQNEVRKGDLFFNTSSETPEEVGICATLKHDLKDVYLNSFCFGFRITDDEVDNEYLAYYFRGSEGRYLMSTLAQGATRYNLSKDNFNKSVITLPPTKKEQQAIANILTTMDNEITSLEAELQKYKALKQGMMQKLLTGEIRLPICQTTE